MNENIDYKTLIENTGVERTYEGILGSEMALSGIAGAFAANVKEFKIMHDYLIVNNATKEMRAEDGFVAYRKGVSDCLEFLIMATAEHSQKQKRGDK